MAIVVGSIIPEVLEGTGDDDVITGLGGNDTLYGFGGNDALDGGTGADSMIGSIGDDSYYVDNIGDRVSETYGEGHDTVYASVSYALTGRVVERLELTGLANIDALGNSQSNYLIGNAGNNRLDGAGGADTMEGGLGNDTYVVDVQADVIIEPEEGGIDTIEINRHFNLTGTVFENLTLTGIYNLNGTGTDGNNVLTGNWGNNILWGGRGDDTYYIQNYADLVEEKHLEGNDTIYSMVSYSLFGRAVETLILQDRPDSFFGAESATGNSLNNTLVGNNRSNTLDGAAGADTMMGGKGSDTYFVDVAGDVIVEAANESGGDEVRTALSYTLGVGLEHLTLLGAANVNATGNSDGNKLTGNSGNNILDGGGGVDSFRGGLGDDTYYVDYQHERVYENHLEGTDMVYSSATYSLDTRAVEILTLTGTANINGTGNSLANTLTGNSGNNVLNGVGGSDTLAGGGGSDTFLFLTGSGSDTIADFSATQNDSINIHAYTNGAANEALVIQSGAHAYISLPGDQWITVQNVNRADVLSHIVW